MPMQIEFCDECNDLSDGSCFERHWTHKITVHTDRELKQAQIEAYEDAIEVATICVSTTDWLDSIHEKIDALKQLMEK